MQWDFSLMSEKILNKENAEMLLQGKWGLEKESLRTSFSGELALSRHPEVFGDKLSNQHITTDFSESQLELITPPLDSMQDTYRFMDRLQQEAETGITGELLWPLSMPTRLPDEEFIPIARYGTCTEGDEKEIYRQGLALRYGKKIQMISGIHYNYSFSEALFDYLHSHFGGMEGRQQFVDQVYFAVARNFLRYRWLPVYLYGASPAIDSTYSSVITEKLHSVERYCPQCLSGIEDYRRYATSLRVSIFGYSNNRYARSQVSFNSPQEYIRNLRTLMTTQSPEYETLGLYQNGRQVQLNSNIFQKESEYYSSIRFKQSFKQGETLLDALEHRGISYLEIRTLDLNPFERLGVSREAMYFWHLFLLFCLLEESKPIDDGEMEKICMNHHQVALFGRKETLVLEHYTNGKTRFNEWSRAIFARLERIAAVLDAVAQTDGYSRSVAVEYAKILNPELLPSARIMREMAEYGEGHIDFGLRRAKENSLQMREEEDVYE